MVATRYFSIASLRYRQHRIASLPLPEYKPSLKVDLYSGCDEQCNCCDEEAILLRNHCFFCRVATIDFSLCCLMILIIFFNDKNFNYSATVAISLKS